MDEEKRRLQAQYHAIDLPPPGSAVEQIVQQPKRSFRALRFLLYAAIWYLLFSCLSDRIQKHAGKSSKHHHSGLKLENETDFSKTARGEVTWFDCGDKEKFPHPFQCGRLKAPLDYTNPADERNASIAIAYWPAGAGETKKGDVLGSILLNPGGPGGSGVDFITRKPDGKQMVKIFDKVLDRRYNLVSFDPRGVERTHPAVDCFGSKANTHLSQVQASAIGAPGSHPKSLDSDYSVQLAASEFQYALCSKNATQKELLQHVSTASVSRDMKLLHKALGDAQLNYWGFSYGTVLGSTYADMFPDDVRRLVIDGVVDVPNYYAGLWSDAFVDIEAEFDRFFGECAQAGPSGCKLASHSRDGRVLKRKYDELLAQLAREPMPAPHAEHPQFLTFTTVSDAMFRALYVPKQWPVLTAALDQALRGNPAPLVNTYGAKPFDDSSTPRTPFAQNAIACADAVTPAPKSSWTLKEYKDFLGTIKGDVSDHFATQFMGEALGCLSAWKTRSPDRHYGNFTSSTAFPLLMLGNDFDPVTPGRNADLMASKFARAVAVRRAGYGHCSLSMPSRCIQKVLKGYFVHGEVPNKGLRCETDADKPIFAAPTKGGKNEASAMTAKERDDEEIAQDMQDIAGAIAESNKRF